MKQRLLFSVVLLLSLLLITSMPLSAAPILYNPNYSIELVASGLGAVNGVDISPSGDIFVTDYQGRRILRIDRTTYAVGVYASGFSYSEDLTFDNDGNLFVTSGSGAPKSIYQVFSDGSSSLFSTGYSYSVGLEAHTDGYLYIGNSGDGTISKIDSGGSSTEYLSGYGGPHGPFGLTFDDLSNLYFVQHGTGEIYKCTPEKSVSLIADLSDFGPTYIEADSDGTLYVSDSMNASIYRIEDGIVSLFASGFTGKMSPPVIGPNGLRFDENGDLFVADGESLWKIVRVPEPVTFILICIGVMNLLIYRKYI
ncbi:MAG: NHL repeat-containing protein [Sedimentisphaerales bacterium]|nr:NHL repeat-containing protein [Sedimentisphaerales bacterium]